MESVDNKEGEIGGTCWSISGRGMIGYNATISINATTAAAAVRRPMVVVGTPGMVIIVIVHLRGRWPRIAMLLLSLLSILTNSLLTSVVRRSGGGWGGWILTPRVLVDVVNFCINKTISSNDVVATGDHRRTTEGTMVILVIVIIVWFSDSTTTTSSSSSSSCVVVAVERRIGNEERLVRLKRRRRWWRRRKAESGRIVLFRRIREMRRGGGRAASISHHLTATAHVSVSTSLIIIVASVVMVVGRRSIHLTLWRRRRRSCFNFGRYCYWCGFDVDFER